MKRISNRTTTALAAAALSCAVIVVPALAASDAHGDDRPAASRYGSYLAGRHAEAINDLGSAAGFMARVSLEEPDNKLLHERTFLLTASAGLLDRAIVLAGPLAGEGDVDVAASLVLLADSLAEGDQDAALARLDALPEGGLNRLLGPVLRAWILFGRDGDIDAAQAQIDSIRAEAGTGTITNMHAGLLYDLAGQEAEARKAFEAAMVAEQVPPFRLVQAYVSLLRRLGETEAANATLQDYYQRNPNSELVRSEMDELRSDESNEPIARSAPDGAAEVFFGAAGGFYRQGEPQVALIFGYLALKLRPDLEIARFLVGDILDSLGRQDEAIGVFRAIDESSPLYWEARMRVAESLAGLGRADEAVGELTNLAELRKHDPEPLNRLGDLMRVEERWDEAVAAYRGALERIAPENPSLWALHYALGIALERSKHWEEAEASLLKALASQPEHPYLLNYLGYSWADQGINLAKARGMIERAVELRPTDGYIVDSLGWVLYRAGEYTAAVRHLERAVELRPTDPVINDHLGDAYWHVGRHQEARFQWQRALSFGSDAEADATIRSKIEHGWGARSEAQPGD
ncbi:MAG: tetratricopeptide repeat protein [Proteobacteria bacterium]|nr:tetratricopeptide repeat protein [Pseudomonadota bacterium]